MSSARYDVAQWPKPLSTLPGHETWTWGAGQYVFAESPNRVFVLQRGELPVIKRPQGPPIRLPQIGPSIEFPMVRLPLRDATTASPPGALFGPDGKTPGDDLDAGKPGVDYRWEHIVTVWDAQGNLIEDWTQWDKMFRRPHAVYISPYDAEKNVWIVDDYRHAIFKFSHDGKKLLQTIGEPNVPGTDDKHFYRPTFMAWLPDGTFFVADGYAEHARREVRQERQVPDDVGRSAARRPRSARATSTTCTASPSIRRRGACSSTIAATAACRCSTRTASISTSGASVRAGSRTSTCSSSRAIGSCGPPIAARRRC